MLVCASGVLVRELVGVLVGVLVRNKLRQLLVEVASICSPLMYVFSDKCDFLLLFILLVTGKINYVTFDKTVREKFT